MQSVRHSHRDLFEIRRVELPEDFVGDRPDKLFLGHVRITARNIGVWMVRIFWLLQVLLFDLHDLAHAGSMTFLSGRRLQKGPDDFAHPR